VFARLRRVGFARSWWAASGFATYLALIALIGALGYQIASGEGLSLPGLSTVQAIWKADTSLPALGQVDREIGADALHDSAAHPSPGAVAQASPRASPFPSGSPGSPPPRPSPNPLPSVFPQPTPKTGTVSAYAWQEKLVVSVGNGGVGCNESNIPGGTTPDCAPLAGVSVTLTSVTGRVLGPALSGADGKWSIPGAQPLTTYSVSCRKQGYATYNQGQHAQTDANGNAQPDSNNDFNCVMLAAGVVTGRVTDANTGKPISGVKVWIEENNNPNVPVSSANSDSNGAYLIRNSSPNHQYLLRASKIGYVDFAVEIQTDANGNVTQDISMAPG
jgi:hypothetical protein